MATSFVVDRPAVRQTNEVDEAMYDVKVKSDPPFSIARFSPSPQLELHDVFPSQRQLLLLVSLSRRSCPTWFIIASCHNLTYLVFFTIHHHKLSRPFKDPVIVSAQILAVFAVFLSVCSPLTNVPLVWTIFEGVYCQALTILFATSGPTHLAFSSVSFPFSVFN